MLKIKWTAGALLLLLGIGLGGCKAVSSFYQGRTAVNDSITTLAEANAEGVEWKTFDMKVTYDVKADGSQLHLKGMARLSDFYQIQMAAISSLDVYLFFLDNNDKVLQTAQLTYSLSPRLDQEMNFDHLLVVPSGATKFALGYSGKAREEGGGGDKVGRGGGGLYFFNDLPKKKVKSS